MYGSCAPYQRTLTGDSVSEGAVDGVKTFMKVLTIGKWPSYNLISVTLHPQINNCLGQFGRWDRSLRAHCRSPGRSLQPLYGLSTVELSLWFVGPHKQNCSMNVPMATILLLFANDSESDAVPGKDAFDLSIVVRDIYNSVGITRRT